MALIDCPECGRQVSDKAPTCPGCGAPIAALESTESQAWQQTASEEPAEAQTRTPVEQQEPEVDEEWLRGEQEYLAFTDRVQRHRIMSVVLFFAGLSLGMGMKSFMGTGGDEGRALVFYIADIMVYAGIIWLFYNEARNLWYHRKLGG
ncbi:zinc-ribbon domain-containing protein [Ectothiorhodospira lacustris]|uniref:zinc-ribbon domain-containing protein n=1 Tax=Ectothiorhodospira lacustris TaxID=2899127 RepID=UPI001EE8865F|nr:zinc ribbon domain-containing protein [Ectothiorhodospira lacustris]MCG5501223.1 zinc-ribbon domain-containing protein [Ectothiorhodospira lacustris]MCG5511017.1 zinc-ribbon domain-containing protein [Ectothiorhodospira lacustris]MCG5522747.1 zinc-ribbon domain-containing protein [Ectothiorhodospira lacustris]